MRFLQDLCVYCVSFLWSPSDGSESSGYGLADPTSLLRVRCCGGQAGRLDAQFVRCNSNRRSLSRDVFEISRASESRVSVYECI